MMKKHFLCLFSGPNRKWTVSFLMVSFLLITVSLVTGMKNNIVMNVMFVAGIGFLYLAVIHSWRNARNYLHLMLAALIAFVLLFLVTFSASNIFSGSGPAGTARFHAITGGLYTIIGLCICIPGMVIGLAGSIVYGYKTSATDRLLEGSE